MGQADRIIRLAAALVLGILFFTHTISGAAGYAALIIAGVFAATSFISFCPLYTLLGINTCKKQAA